MCQLQLQSGPNVFAEFRSEKSGGKNQVKGHNCVYVRHYPVGVSKPKLRNAAQSWERDIGLI